MNILLDTSALIAVRNADDKKHTYTLESTNIALMERLNIETLFTFDTEFKGLVNLITE